MKVKTNELTGAALDWAVAMTENWAGADFDVKPYSTDWADGGPIIEREKISTCWEGTTWVATLFNKNCGETWYGHQYGPTPLIAAMRCYCSSKLGDEVEVPDELVSPL